MAKVIVVGGGAAGMAAAVFLGQKGHQVCLLEKNEKLGKKLFITGKGRCNITNACDPEEFFQSVVTNEKFMYSSFYGFTNWDAIAFFEELGVQTKMERGNRIFPQSDHSSDVIRALEKQMKAFNTEIHLNCSVKHILTEDGICTGVCLENGKTIYGDCVIVATGGCSYQATGSTGDGYLFAEETGHAVTERIPALVPIEAKEEYITRLQGLSLKNVRLEVKDKKKVLYDAFGEMMFTHFGVTGPLILTASSYLGKRLLKGELSATIDLKAALTKEQLDARLLREFEAAKNKQFKNTITGLFPAKLYPVMLELSGIPADKKVNEITKEERMAFIHLMKHFPLTFTGLRPLREAIITQGGVNVKEIDPKTMMSKKVEHLYFIGEVLDLDAVTGGFNLQVAWSTAYAAAQAVAEAFS